MAFVITGFHAVEERIKRSLDDKNKKKSDFVLKYSKKGPRVKKILEEAEKGGIKIEFCTENELDLLVKSLPETARDHRGLVLVDEGKNEGRSSSVDFDSWVRAQKMQNEGRKTVLILDSITDPHNVGAILRSCDQFGADLVVIPARRSANDLAGNEIIARSSAGANAYVPVSVVTNLTRAVQMLKDAGFWVYGADAGGVSLEKTDFAGKTAVIMGSEGSGISRLLQSECDSVVSIPTCGKIDSLNVSVAAGIILYELYRRKLENIKE